MAYTPTLAKVAVLRTGADLHSFFDHPNHSGFSQADHADAAHWHHSKAMEHEHFKESDKAEFHHAQGILHAKAAAGESTQIRKVPSPEVMNTLTPERRERWERETARINKSNSELKAIEKYRMSNMLSKCSQDLTKTSDDDTIKRLVKQRQAVRGGSQSSEDSGSPALAEDHKALIRAKIAERRGNRGG